MGWGLVSPSLPPPHLPLVLQYTHLPISQYLGPGLRDLGPRHWARGDGGDTGVVHIKSENDPRCDTLHWLSMSLWWAMGTM